MNSTYPAHQKTDPVEEHPQPISRREQYTTKAGLPVIVYAVDKGGTHPVHVGTQLPDGSWQLGKRTRYGQVNADQDSDRDLVIKLTEQQVVAKVLLKYFSGRPRPEITKISSEVIKRLKQTGKM